MHESWHHLPPDLTFTRHPYENNFIRERWKAILMDVFYTLTISIKELPSQGVVL